MTIPQYINHAVYDKHGACIWAVSINGTHQLLLDVRGWGHISNLFPEEDEATKFQDEVGQWITDAINEKLKQK